jgi:signal transduction histidine kinase
MKPLSKEQRAAKDKPANEARLEAARRIIEEYAAELREIIKNLRRKLN